MHASPGVCSYRRNNALYSVTSVALRVRCELNQEQLPLKASNKTSTFYSPCYCSRFVGDPRVDGKGDFC